VGRKPLIAGNWKMNLTHLEAIALMQKFAFALPEKYYDKVEVAVLPPFTHIRSIQTMIDGDGLLMVHGAQDLSPHDAGAYTGDVSGVMLAKLGCRYVVVGHSERRNGITPILCVGEGLPVREEGEHLGHCTSQLTGALAKVTAEQAADLVVAYEPIWAIGTGRVASPADAQEVCAALRTTLATLYGEEQAAGMRILYGGSVKSNNVAELMAGPDVDGALVGGASIDVDEFPKLCALAAGGPLP
jgi:triosephosphate isomerase